jgi:segregation and condensation protein B
MPRTRSDSSRPAAALDFDSAPDDSQASADLAPGEVNPDQSLWSRVEALLISTDRPLTEARIADILGLAGKGSTKLVVAAIEELNGSYEQAGRSFRAERLAGGWQILTLPAFGPVLNRLHTERLQTRLSQPALETLAIIAYRSAAGGIMRAEIEAIRGVASGEVLRGLLERRLIKIVGRAEELGRPMLYGTTKEFLKVFGLAGLDDLPAIQGSSADAGRDRTALPATGAGTQDAPVD